MPIIKKSYLNTKWHSFAHAIKSRDRFRCLKCGRTEQDSILQVHHRFYKPDLQPWEYAMSDCITLCKGCHAEVHNKIEPSKGWTLVSVYDLGGLYGICERIGCGHEIRHEHEIYHPDWGYKIVGSTCVEYLTAEDKWLGAEVLKKFDQISRFLNNSTWELGYTLNNKPYLVASYKYHLIRIYGHDNFHSFQIGIKVLGSKYIQWRKPEPAKNKTLIEVKEMAFIVLLGTISQYDYEKDILRNIYKQMLVNASHKK